MRTEDDANLTAVLHRFPVYKPIVAAVNGTCVAGHEMLTSTDVNESPSPMRASR